MSKDTTKSAENKKPALKKARKKYFSYGLAVNLANLSPRPKLFHSYLNTLACAKTLVVDAEGRAHSKYCKNRWCPLCQSIRIAKLIDGYKGQLEQYPELIRTLYNQLAATDYFQAYMSASESSFKADAALLATFFEKELQDCPMLDDVLEEQSILWSDDLGFVLTLVIRTISNMRQSHADVKMLPEFKSDEDAEFVKTLFEKTLINYNERLEYIEKFTRNWDVERIVFMDNLIMATAITELVSFPSIPVKVTLDEYIDIAKFYSTPGSSTFINGVLDKIVEALTEEGKLKKTGRGLI